MAEEFVRLAGRKTSAPQKYSFLFPVLISVRSWVNPRDMRLEGWDKLKTFGDFTGSRTRDLAACRIVPQPSRLRRDPQHVRWTRNMSWISEWINLVEGRLNKFCSLNKTIPQLETGNVQIIRNGHLQSAAAGYSKVCCSAVLYRNYNIL
jgi:hypothetical protein